MRLLSVAVLASVLCFAMARRAHAQAPVEPPPPPPAGVAPLPQQPAPFLPPPGVAPQPAPPAVIAQPPAPAPTFAESTAPLMAVHEAPGQMQGPGCCPRCRFHQGFGCPMLAVDGYPLAGWHNDLFYLRDQRDNFRLYVGGLLHVDGLSYFGPGVSDTELKTTMLLRRARLTLDGEILRNWQFALQVELGPSAFDNRTGTAEQAAAPAGTQPTAWSGTYAPAQAASIRAALADAYVNYAFARPLNVQVGQFIAPFTMENRTSPNYTSFMENSLAVRDLGIPQVRDVGAMLWGALDKNMFYYSAGVFQGEGPNRPNADNRADTFMRTYVRPLARSDSPVRDLQIGASFHYGMRDKNRVAYDYPGMSTQGGFVFWQPSYRDSVIDPATGQGRIVHIIPSGAQVGVAGELRIPIERFELRGEFVYIHNDTREGADGFQVKYTERYGTLKGYSYYVQVSYWPWGKARFIPQAGELYPAHLDFNKHDPGLPPQGLELLAKWEQLSANYGGAARDGSPDAKNADGDIRVNALSVGANYWATRHVRLTLNYVLNMFPDSAPRTATVTGGPTWSSTQRAVAPGNTLDKGVDDSARDTAHLLHELMGRVAVAF